MTHKRIHRILLNFRALSWAAREVGVNRGTLSRFLRGERPVAKETRLKVQMEELARNLLRTKGAVMYDVDGKSVRSHLAKLRRGGKTT